MRLPYSYRKIREVSVTAVTGAPARRRRRTKFSEPMGAKEWLDSKSARRPARGARAASTTGAMMFKARFFSLVAAAIVIVEAQQRGAVLLWIAMALLLIGMVIEESTESDAARELFNAREKIKQLEQWLAQYERTARSSEDKRADVTDLLR